GNLTEWQDSSANVLGKVRPEGAFAGALAMLLHHASFSNYYQQSSGGAPTVTARDGSITILNAAPTAANTPIPNVAPLTRGDTNNLTEGLDRPGAFLSARARWRSAINAFHSYNVVAGGEKGGFILNEHFGFQAAGGDLRAYTVSSAGGSGLTLCSNCLTQNTWADLY